jgi:hypothetical protein
MTNSPVTAVGRLLKSKHGEPRIYEVIKVKPDGSAEVVISEPLPDREKS